MEITQPHLIKLVQEAAVVDQIPVVTVVLVEQVGLGLAAVVVEHRKVVTLELADRVVMVL
jgi:hypothetical protein